MAYIQVDQVTHFFQAGSAEHTIPTLNNVTFEIQRGEFVSLLGPSGCGKTTLLRIMHGLAKPISGRILVDGKEVQGPETQRAMVFQDFGLLPWRTTLQNIEMGLEFQGVRKETRRKVALEMVQVVGLQGFEKHYPYQLSGGMKQRVGLGARAPEPGDRLHLCPEAERGQMTHGAVLPGPKGVPGGPGSGG